MLVGGCVVVAAHVPVPTATVDAVAMMMVGLQLLALAQLVGDRHDHISGADGGGRGGVRIRFLGAIRRGAGGRRREIVVVVQIGVVVRVVLRIVGLIDRACGRHCNSVVVTLN